MSKFLKKSFASVQRIICVILLQSDELYMIIHIKSSFYKGMTEFQEGEVSVICRKIILIHGQGPGFCYLQVKRFK